MLEQKDIATLNKDFHHSVKAIKGLRCSAHLDLLRGLDAVMVVIVHFLDMFYKLSFDNPSLIAKAAMFLVVQGISSVITFFVLSGYLISMSIFDPLRKGTFNWKSYLVNRFSRLYVVLIPALCLGAFWDILGARLYGANSVYNGVSLGSICVPPSVVKHITWENFIGQLFFLQDIRCHTFGSNGVLWSLSCEFWYYIIFPCLLLAFYKGRQASLKKRILLCLTGLAGIAFIGPLMTFRFLLWLMGTALIFVPLSKLVRHSKGLRVTALVLGIICFIWRLTLTPTFPDNKDRFLLEFLLGLSCMLCMFFVLHDKEPLKKNVYEKGSEFLAAFSYSLYLVHMPFLFFLRATFIKEDRWPLDWEHAFYGGGVLLLVLFYAWLVAQLTENHTAKVREWAMQMLGEGKKKAAVAAADNIDH